MCYRNRGICVHKLLCLETDVDRYDTGAVSSMGNASIALDLRSHYPKSIYYVQCLLYAVISTCDFSALAI